TKNFHASVSFAERKGVFTSTEGISEVDFPVNKLKAQIEEVVWDMGDPSLVPGGDETVISMKNALFSSYGKDKDSLEFKAETARFYLKDRIVDAEGIEYIDVADSRIFPSSQKLVIQSGSKIDTIKNATVWIGKEDKTHVIYHADIEITSGSEYKGKGEY